MTEPIDRRRFLGQSLAAAIALEIAANSSLAASTVETLLAQADPRIVMSQPAVSVGENAYPLLERLALGLTPEPLNYRVFPDGTWGDVPEEELRGLHKAWLENNPAALGQLEEAMRLSGCEYPRGPHDQQFVTRIEAFRSLMRLMIAQARMSLEAGEPAEAARVIQLSAQAFRRLRLGSGVLVETMISAACETELQHTLLEIAVHPKCDVTLLRTMLASQPPDFESKAALSRSLQAEFCKFMLPELAKLSNCSRDDLFPTILPWSDSELITREQYDLQMRQLREVFRDHPCPLDTTETARLGSERFAKFIDDLDQPWPVHRTQPADRFSELDAWPPQLGLSGLLGPAAEAMSQERVAEARGKLGRVHNPVGKRILDTNAIESRHLHQMALMGESRYAGVRLLCALLIFERLHGALPKSLSELEAERHLTPLPKDPYCEADFGYSPADRVAWSVGSSGKLTPQNSADDEDEVETLVWRVPQLKK